MESKINYWNDEINGVSEKFREAFGDLTPTELNWKATASSWSIGQVMDHLITINESYYPIFKKAEARQLLLPFYSKISFVTSFLGNMILKSVKPEQKRKTKTFPIWEPATSDIRHDIVDRFMQNQNEMIGLIRDSEDLLENKTVVHSPASVKIVYTIEKVFDIIIAHEKRHFNQAVLVLELQRSQVAE